MLSIKVESQAREEGKDKEGADEGQTNTISVAIIFFMLFITLTLTFKRMAEAFVLDPILAVWMPNLIILPIGFFLTYKAMNDSKVFDATRLRGMIDYVVAKFRRKKAEEV